MAKPVKHLTFEEWEAQFKPVKNHLDANASFDGIMFETYDEEAAYVQAQNTACIWTFQQADDALIISEGWHYVNRLGYFVTEVARSDPHQSYEILVSEEDASEQEGVCHA